MIIPNIWENNKCSKPPTRYNIHKWMFENCPSSGESKCFLWKIACWEQMIFGYFRFRQQDDCPKITSCRCVLIFLCETSNGWFNHCAVAHAPHIQGFPLISTESRRHASPHWWQSWNVLHVEPLEDHVAVPGPSGYEKPILTVGRSEKKVIFPSHILHVWHVECFCYSWK